jgi:hypothetical protein
MKGLKDKNTGRFVKNLKDKNCLTCNKLFHPRFSKVKFCSKKCNGLAFKKDRKRKCVICNNEFEAQSLKTRFCSQECYTKSGIRAPKGDKSHTWKGGITPINLSIRTSSKYIEWIKTILKRDDYTCQWCLKRGIKFQVDHIIPFAKIIDKLKFEQGIDNLYQKAMNYELLWDLNNGRTLCVECHKKTDSYLKNYKKVK